MGREDQEPGNRWARRPECGTSSSLLPPSDSEEVRRPEDGTPDSRLPTPDSEEVLVEAEMLLRAIGRASRPELLEQIGARALELEDPLLSIVEEVPRAVGRRISDALREVATDDPSVAPLSRSAADPRNYREAAQILHLVSDGASPSAVAAVAGSVSDLLPGLGATAKLLLAADRRGRGALTYEDGIARVGDASLSVSEATAFLSRLRSWHPARALAVVLSRSDSAAELGRYTAPPAFSGEDPLWMLERRTTALLPGPDAAPAEVAVDPLPKDLSAPLDLSPHALVREEGAVEPARRERMEEVIRASLRAVSLVLQRPVFSLLSDVTFVLHPEPASTAWLDPTTSTVHVFSGPMGPYVVIHELGHLVDARLRREEEGGRRKEDRSSGAADVFSSEDPGSALHAFAEAARPLYRPVVQARARRYAEGMLDSAAGSSGAPEEERLPLEDLVRRIRFLDGIEDAAARIAAGEGERLASEGGPTSRSERALLGAIGDGLVLEGESVLVDRQAMLGSLEAHEADRLLSSHEIFARFFDQYTRILLDKKKMAFGPRIRPCDLDAPAVLRLAPAFLAALLSEQEKMLHERAGRHSVGLLSDTVAAAVVAAAGVLGAVLSGE